MKPLKKVVLINGSPKKERSTTLNVAKAFIDGLKEEYDVKLSTFTISDLHIKIKLLLGIFALNSIFFSIISII